MIPKISVTTCHTPETTNAETEYNNILEGAISHLQHIRDNIQNNVPVGISSDWYYGKMSLSLPDLRNTTAVEWASFNPITGLTNGFKDSRRKSWSTIDKSTGQKYFLDNEKNVMRPGVITVGTAISTHSFNDTEFCDNIYDMSKIQFRIPLHKSLSTPSIPPACEGMDGDPISIVRHFSDTDDENNDDCALLCVTEKSEVDHPEKRRKRGSLFFRKRKDKSKSKTDPNKHDGSIASRNYPEHRVFDINSKESLKQLQYNRLLSKKGFDNSQHHHAISIRLMGSFKDATDGISHNTQQGEHAIDETALLQYEFLNEAHLIAHHLDDDPVLGIGRETEHESWSPRVGPKIIKHLTAVQIKRQEHIYELIITEKRHCQILCLMQKVFVNSLQQHFSTLNSDRLFPRLDDLLLIHKHFLKRLRIKQDVHPIVDSIADILLEFFSDPSAAQLKSVYGEFCANHQVAVDTFKYLQNTDQRFATWHKYKQTNPLLKRKGIPECTLFVVQRLTKYPILIEDQLKLTPENDPEREKLLLANSLIKSILIDVNAQVAQKENDDRHLDIFKRIEAKSFTIYRNKKFKKSDITCSGRKLKFEGSATLMQGRDKVQTVIVVVLSDCLFFLNESSGKLHFFTPANKTGVVSLQKLIIREKATDDRGIYLISSLPSHPEMFELKVQLPKDKQTWIKAIRSAVVQCPSTGAQENKDISSLALSEEKKREIKLNDNQEAECRDLIKQMRIADLEHAILLEQKIALHTNYLSKIGLPFEAISIGGAETFLSDFATYRHILGHDASATSCDTVDLMRRTENTVHEISTLVGKLYHNMTGVEFPAGDISPCSCLLNRKGTRGEHQHHYYNDHITYKHPVRSETFSGFDEKMSKPIMPKREADVSSMSSCPYELHLNKEAIDTVSLTPSFGVHSKRLPTDAISSSFAETNRNSTTTSTSLNAENQTCINRSSTANTTATAKDHQNALCIAHHLYSLMAVVYQQMSTIAMLQNELRDNPRTVYRHDVQLEELRNLQDKFQEEKTVWIRQRDLQEAELKVRLAEQSVQQQRLHDEQEDIREQREQLFRKMEKMERMAATTAVIPAVIHENINFIKSNIVVGTPLMDGKIKSTVVQGPFVCEGDICSSSLEHISTSMRSKAESEILNNNKGNTIKQTLPLKLSSSKHGSKLNNNVFSPTVSSTTQNSAITQILPLKLAYRKPSSNHIRTCSSPAIVQPHNVSTTMQSTMQSSDFVYQNVRYNDRIRTSRCSDTEIKSSRLASIPRPSAMKNYADQQQSLLAYQQKSPPIYQHSIKKSTSSVTPLGSRQDCISSNNKMSDSFELPKGNIAKSPQLDRKTEDNRHSNQEIYF